MSQTSNRFAIGIFVLGALVLFVGGVVLLGSGVLFRETQRYVTFFDGSVKGLKAGALVLFRGVHIGEVKRVVLQVDHRYEQVRIPVIFEIYPGSLMEVGERPKEKGAVVRRMIEQGLRAQLESQSFVTGVLTLNLDFHPGSEAKMIGEMPDMMEIPSLPSKLDLISDALGDLPLTDIVSEVRVVVSRVAALLASKDLEGLPKDIVEALQEFRVTAKVTQEFVELGKDELLPVTQELRNALTAVEEAMKGFSEISHEAKDILRKDSPSRYQIDQLLLDVRKAAEQLRSLTEFLERHPEALLRGK